MFVQVIQGQVSDASALKDRLDAWSRDLAPGADGWLGTTAGVTDDGVAVAVVRFASEEQARRNSERPEQGEWWAGTVGLYTGEPEFRDSVAVDLDLPGDPAGAGFVQVMQGRTTDPDRARALMAADPTDWATFRPEILGTVNVIHAGGEWTMASYFTSEEDAREGERKEMPPEAAQLMKELDSLAVGPPRFYDLRDPWLDAPG